MRKSRDKLEIENEAWSLIIDSKVSQRMSIGAAKKIFLSRWPAYEKIFEDVLDEYESSDNNN